MPHNILYLSAHSILEYDEIKLFSELGHNVISLGAYVEPGNVGDSSMRPALAGMDWSHELRHAYHQMCKDLNGQDSKDHLTAEFLQHFDVVVVMHIPRWISNNWHVFEPFIQRGGRVIWRTIGQSIENIEDKVRPYRHQGLQIVRYSPMERNIPGYIGEDALIRFYKDPDEYGPWVGDNNRVVTFAQSMQGRGPACNFELFEEVTRSFPRHLFGPGNEGLPWSSGKVSYDQLKLEMRVNRVYFYTGTHPASYTLNFIEALMSGMPMVCIGPQHGNASYFPGHTLYEIPHIIESGVNGFISDDRRELAAYVKMMLENHLHAKLISANARKTAVKLFGKDAVKQDWKAFLG